MQIPIIKGIYTNDNPEFRTAYPRNLIVVPKTTGMSDGYLKPAEGVTTFATGPGVDRGAINWNDVCYRVMGTKLVRVNSDGTVDTLGDVGGTTQVTMNYSFDRLGIASNGNLFYWDGSTLTQVVDADLGTCVDMIWIDGYFMSTDGEFIVVTDIADPTSVSATKYTSSEADPDPIKALLKIRNEVVALNRYTIEFFDNVGGAGFPFARIDGAQIYKGTVGTHACCEYRGQVAFLGSGRNEEPGVWLGMNGEVRKLSSREIDQILYTYTETQLSSVVLEAHNESELDHLYVRLPDRTLVYDDNATQHYGEKIWVTLTSTVNGFGQHRVSNRTWVYDKWLVGDPQSSNVGAQTNTVSTHWGEEVGWDFYSMILYNEGKGAIVHRLELVCLTGRVSVDVDPYISTEYSTDGVVWSMRKYIKSGKQGFRNKRLVWLRQGHMKHWRMQRFSGTSNSNMAFARLDADVEPLMN